MGRISAEERRYNEQVNAAYQDAQRQLRRELVRISSRDYTSTHTLKQRESEFAYRVSVVAAGARSTLVNRSSIGLGYGVSAVGTEVLNQVLNEAGGVVFAAIQSYLRDTQRQISRGTGLEKMHEEVALGAKRSILAAYDGSVGGPAPNRGYRPNSRLTGRMRNALRAMKPEVSRDSINLIDDGYLDAAAAHWRRLNYGTKGVIKQKPTREFPMRFEGAKVGSLADRTAPSPGFVLPPGFWVESGTRLVVPFSGSRALGRTDMFFPQSEAPGIEKKAKQDLLVENERRAKVRREPLGVEDLLKGPKKSRGIKGYRFTDAGLRYIGEVYPTRLADVAVSWFEESRRAIKPVTRTVKAR